MKILLSFLLIFCVWVGKAEAQKAKADTCVVGVFITDIFDLNLSEKSFKTSFWVWFNYKKDSLDLLNNAEITNAKDYSYSLATTEQRGNLKYSAQKGKAEIKKIWDITNFPLDRQHLKVVIESGDKAIHDLVFIADTINSKCDKVVSLDGWKIKNFKIKSSKRTYTTNYGDPALKQGASSSFATVEFSVDIERESQGLFFKLFTGLYVAFGISLLVFFMGPENAERFGLLVGSLFAAIANKYVVDGMLPDSIKYTLVDKIHVMTFCYVLINLILTVIAYRLYTSEHITWAKRLDAWSFWLVLASYVGMNYWFISHALR